MPIQDRFPKTVAYILLFAFFLSTGTVLHFIDRFFYSAVLIATSFSVICVAVVDEVWEDG